MRILQICSKPPYPEKDGYALAVNHISKAIISKGHSLKVIAISTPKHHAKDVPQEYLAKMFKKNNICYYQKQSQFDFEKALKESQKFTGFLKKENQKTNWKNLFDLF